MFCLNPHLLFLECVWMENFREFKILGNLNDSIKFLSFLNTFVWIK